MTAELVCPSCGERVPANFAQCWKCNAELSKASPAPGARKIRCSYCEGTDIETGIAVASGDQSRFGLPQTPLALGLSFAGDSALRDLKGGSLELLRADLCKECGTVVRLSVDEVDRAWVKR